VLGPQGCDGQLALGLVVDDAAATVDTYPPDAFPHLVVVVDEQRRHRVLGDVAQAAECIGRLRLLVRARHDDVPVVTLEHGEADRHEVRAAVRAYRREPADARVGDAPPHLRFPHARDDTVAAWRRDCWSRAARAGAWGETRPSS